MSLAFETNKTAAEIAFALGGHKKSGTGFVCKCPAHKDDKASLSIGQGDSGKLIWKCHAGCDQQAVFEALKQKGLLPERERSPVRSSGPKRIVKEHDYRDADGKLLFQVVRFEPKSFAQRVPDRSTDTGWKWGLNGVRTVLYRMPEVAIAQKVYIVEGEKDVENLVALGVTATTSPMGADKWRAWYSQALKGKDLVFIPDNDEPGRQHVRHAVADCMAAGAASVKILHLDGLDEKGDVSDWIAAGNGLVELMALEGRTAPVEAEDLDRTPEWTKKLQRSEEGQARNSEYNTVIALRFAPQLAGAVRWNEFAQRVETRGIAGMKASKSWRRWTDTDEIALTIWLQEHGMASIRPGTVSDAVTVYADLYASTHPIKDYLQRLSWDRKERLDNWLSVYCGVEDTAYVREVARRWLIAAVARVMDPGCKVDVILVLEGPQGTGKSSILKALGGQWYSDQLGGEIGSKDAKAGLAGKWIIEHGELAHLTKASLERIKQFFSEQVDQYRPAYGRNEVEVPRQCVFVGTTNVRDYLRDETGNRRFWPVECHGRLLVQELQHDRDQLWAEAVHAYTTGERWWLEGEEILAAAGKEQEARVQDDVWDPLIVDWANRQAIAFTMHDCIKGALQKESSAITRADELRVGSILRRYGFDKRRERQGHGRFHFWSKEDGPNGTNGPAEVSW